MINFGIQSRNAIEIKMGWRVLGENLEFQ